MSNDLFDLSGEVAVVIGGTGVLGGALAEGLAAAGAAVAVLGRNRDRGLACAKRIADSGNRGAFFFADATEPIGLAAAHKELEADLGAPTILVNAAGGNDPKVTVTADNPFERIEATDWRASFDLNLVGGALLPCQEFGPGMARRGRGSVINIASVSAHLPLSRVVAYSAAKAAVLSLTQFLAREWAPKGVRVNSVTPGFFPAEQNRGCSTTPTARRPRAPRSILGHTPMGRFRRRRNSSTPVVFLASRRAQRVRHGDGPARRRGFLSQTI